MAWESRIIGHGEAAPSDLVGNPRNWRTHPQAQRDALAGVLDEVGWVQDVIVNKRTGYLVDGHARVAVAAQRGEDAVPVVYVDLSEDEERLILSTLDPLSAMAEADSEALTDLLAVVPAEDGALNALLDALATDAGAALATDRGLTDPDDVPDPIEDHETYVERGQVYALGDHRLMCGDATSAEDVSRLMGGAVAEMVWTDPPYGVGIGDKNAQLNAIGEGPSNRVTRNLTNDTLAEGDLSVMLKSSFDNALEVCAAGAAWYVASPAGPLMTGFGSALKDMGIWRQTIQWVKNNATFAPMGVDYHWKSEPIFYGWAPNAAHRYRGGRSQTTVWEIDRPSKSPEHPTMKPVELVLRAIENSSDRGHVVFDPFIGSGTTIIAAEQSNRSGYGMEIDPQYAQLVINRWEDFTGRSAEFQKT